MLSLIDKRDRAAAFRTRLAAAVERAGLSQSALARAVGVDRSTVSQLLGSAEPRLPNAQLAADCAQVLGVSSDWLLSLTDRPERPGKLLEAVVSLSEAERTVVDEQLLAWQREAAGYKIRHVPASLPDLLKTEAVMRWEYDAFLGVTPDQAIGAMRDRVNELNAGTSDFELAMSLGELDAFAAGAGYWKGLPAEARREQLSLLAARCASFYPTLRLFLFDARRVFSAPVTVFGPLIGVIYVGRFYLAFREAGRVRSLARHFDWLVREAEVDARDAARHIAALGDRVA
ncbi:MAG TPA: helix-turn-helix transcriptional regulator [Thermohalobaculum sp.]|nr:helix-turn-helix transcriptional regulator [Thermohalobaculum sp.]